MRGADESGIVTAKGGSAGRYDKFSPSLDELTGLGPEADRDGAVIALAVAHGWSPARLAVLFGISPSHVRRIVADFRAEYGDGH